MRRGGFGGTASEKWSEKSDVEPRGADAVAPLQTLRERREHALELAVEDVEVEEGDARDAHPPDALSVAVDDELSINRVARADLARVELEELRVRRRHEALQLGREDGVEGRARLAGSAAPRLRR